MPTKQETNNGLFLKLFEEFDPRDWSRGSDYAGSALMWVSTENDLFLAQVQGSARQPYGVSLDLAELRDGFVGVGCTCPRFVEEGNCKHLAGLVQAAGLAGFFDKYPAPRRIQLVDSDDFFPASTDDDWDEDPDHDYEDEWEERNYRQPTRSNASPTSARARQYNPAPSGWRGQLAQIEALRKQVPPPPVALNAKVRKLHIVFDLGRSAYNGAPVLVLFYQEQLKNGSFSTIKRCNFSVQELLSFFSASDTALIQLLLGNQLRQDNYSVGISQYSRVSQFVLPPQTAAEQLAKCCAAGVCSIVRNTDDRVEQLTPVFFDAGSAWQFQLDWDFSGDKKTWTGRPGFVRTAADGTQEKLSLEETLLIFGYEVLVCADRFARADRFAPELLAWIGTLRGDGAVVVPQKELPEFAKTFYGSDPPAAIDLPEPVRWQRVRGEPKPQVQLSKNKSSYRDNVLAARLQFNYEGTHVKLNTRAATITDTEGCRLIERDFAAESRWIAELKPLGFTQPDYYLRGDADLQLTEKKLPFAVAELTSRGWKVEAEGIAIRRPGKFNISVTSGVDWFDLAVDCDFDGLKAALPDLLKAVQNGERFVTLGDGTRGMLPDEWLKKYAPIAEMGKPEGDSLRFLPSQAMILDAMLAAQPEAQIDATFRRVREKLRSFDGVKARQEPASFQGTLREYQREGLGWLDFLREFRFGGCLADDMGLGKTIQVLAMLETIRASRAKKNTDTGPSLVVAPKSLVFNWIDEASRFTPNLKVLNHTGIERKPITESAAEHDLVVTTYGTLRRDILELSKVPFHYAILDEAQAIKNASSQSAKSCRLLQATHRLAMTGTPVENQLGDLWSIFEFLNPGMLGRSNQLAMFAGKARPEAESVELLAKALRPFLLRRTKEQVLKELPEKTEQTLYCELEPKQRKLYNELRDHYRALLAKKIETVGLAKSKIHVLEALLRLRQAACHPALVDKSNQKLPSAKLDALIEQLAEVIDEKHKVLVFSQFTSLLSLVKPKLEERGITYEYLDGKTRDRKAKVERFQNDESCRVFLISLKAGGHGLNLTAADYVFILDPWWNPAVEMQAVDRAHRLGQTKPVFAYRLIARETVEEKILELQKQKRSLAEAVITADENLLRALSAEDLQILLS